MSDEGSPSELSAVTAKVIPELAGKALGPAAEELGKGLVTVSKLVNMALSPVEGVVWGYEQIRGYIVESLSRKLDGTAPEDILSPPANVAVPAIEALRYTGTISELRELFSNLLATAMKSDSQSIAHPAFVDIIKQLSVDEAKILSSIVVNKRYPLLCEAHYDDKDPESTYEYLYPEFTSLCRKACVEFEENSKSYLGNLQRLNIFEIRHSGIEELVEKDSGYALRPYDDVMAYELSASRSEALYVTSFGQQFLKACVIQHDKKAI